MRIGPLRKDFCRRSGWPHNSEVNFPVIRLQVQRSPLKPGRAPERWYDPAPLQQVEVLEMTPDGAIGTTADGERILDVHHRRHQQTRDPKGRGGISVMGTGDYRVLRERYGPHLVDGIAGESVLVEADPGLAGLDLPDSVRLVGDHTLELREFRVANPCVEFTRLCLRLPFDSPVDDRITQGLVDLGAGARGYRAWVAGDGPIRLGDRLELTRSVPAQDDPER